MLKRMRLLLIINTMVCFQICIFNNKIPIYLRVIFFTILVCLLLLNIFIVYIPIKKFERGLKSNDLEVYKSKADVKKIPYIKEINEKLKRCIDDVYKINEERMLDKEVEISALQSQINPHFLYNTLESIRGQAIIDKNYEIAKMIESLAAFFRYSIGHTKSLVTLRTEIFNIKNYMNIQRYRFNNRFEMIVEVEESDEECYNFMVPKLMLQPIVENAINHGLDEKISGGVISIEIIVTDINLIITISDNGKGMEDKELEELNDKINGNLEVGTHKKTGIALYNINKRIQLLFGKSYGISVYSTLDYGTDVEICIPIKKEEE